MDEGTCTPDQGASHAQERGQAFPSCEFYDPDVSGGARRSNFPDSDEEGRSMLGHSNALGMVHREGSDHAVDSPDGDAATQRKMLGSDEGLENAVGEGCPCVGSRDGPSRDCAREGKSRRRAATRECKLLLAGSVWEDLSAERRGTKRNAAVAGEAGIAPTGGLCGRPQSRQCSLSSLIRMVADASQGRQGARGRVANAKASRGPTRQSGAREEAQHDEQEQQGGLRGGLHLGGEEGQGQGQDPLPREVVWVRPSMGAVERERPCGGGSGVVGAALQPPEHGGATTLEIPETNTTGHKHHVRGERCQRNGCLALRQRLADVREELLKCTNERNNLLATWEEQLNGARRILASDFHEVEEERDEAWRQERATKQRRAQDIKMARRLHEEKAELLDKVAMVQAQNAILKADVARLLVEEHCRRKQELREVNICELKLREANRILKRAEKLRAEAMLMNEDAARKATKAQQEVDDAKQLADNARQEAQDAWHQADATNRVVEENARKAIADAEESAADARKEAQAARDEAIAAYAEVDEIRKESDLAKQGQLLAQRQAEKAEKQARESKEKLAKIAACHPTTDRSVDEWAALGRCATYKAGQRERGYLRAFLQSHSWRPEDIAGALSAEGLLEPLFDTREGFQSYFDKVKVLVQKLEQEDFGIAFGLFLRYEMRMTTDKILRMTQAACKRYVSSKDFYEAKVLLYHPFRKDLVVKVRGVSGFMYALHLARTNTSCMLISTAVPLVHLL